MSVRMELIDSCDLLKPLDVAGFEENVRFLWGGLSDLVRLKCMWKR
jgi:hypothetical protein